MRTFLEKVDWDMAKITLEMRSVPVRFDPGKPTKTAECAKRIDFFIGDMGYFFWLYRLENRWIPERMYHGENIDCCPVCKSEGMIGYPCEAFNEKLEEVAEKVMNLPAIRLKLLFT